VQEQGVDESRYHTFYAISLAKSSLKNIQDSGEESENVQMKVPSKHGWHSKLSGNKLFWWAIWKI
jgi:hypothetical protein